jgi:acetylglutamate kinase
VGDGLKTVPYRFKTAMQPRPLVLKVGGELLEDSHRLATVVSALATIRASETEVVIVHGGGKEIDAALRASGIEKRQVDGLRITDDATLGIVVSVLAGTINTRFVAALSTAGVPAVGLTGADDKCVLSAVAPPHSSREGGTVDLGRVGVPIDAADVSLLRTLLDGGFVPVLASLGVDRNGRLLNVNADTLAGHIAARLRARRLVIAGTTAGVLGSDGRTVETLDASGIGALIVDGTATAGMIAKLRACEHALGRGVEEVLIVDGRDRTAFVGAARGDAATGITKLQISGDHEIADFRL